jgi:Flp pilus assembly protein TadD
VPVFLRSLSWRVWLSLAGIVVSFCAVAASSPRTGSIVFADFDLPEPLRAKGYSSRVLAHEIADEISGLRSRAASRMHAGTLAAGEDGSSQDTKIEISGETLPLASLRSLVQRLRRGDYSTVSGEVLLGDGDSGGLSVRIDDSAMTTLFALDHGRLPRAALQKAAEFIMEQREPYLLALALYSSDSARARAVLSNATRSPNLGTRALALAGLGLLAQREERYAEAEVMYRLSMEADNRLPLPVINLVSLYYQRDRNWESLRLADSVPDNEGWWAGVLWLNRAATLIDLGDYRAAAQSARRALAVGEDPSARRYLAYSLLAGGELDKAEIEYRRLQSMHEASILDRSNLAVICLLRHNKECFKTRAGALDSLPDAVRTRLALLVAGDSVYGDSLLVTLRSSDDSAAAAGELLGYAETLSANSFGTEAERLSDLARQLGPARHLSRIPMARILCRRGRSDSAASLYRQLVREDNVLYGTLDTLIKGEACERLLPR